MICIKFPFAAGVVDMLTSFFVLPISSIQFLLLIAAVYIFTFSRIYRYARFTIPDTLLILAQITNLSLLLRYITGYESGFPAVSMSYYPSYIAQGIFIVLIFIRITWSFRVLPARRQRLVMPLSIRETIDYLPGGICFSTPNGRPILTNRKMNELVFALTKHTIANTLTTWEELRQFNSANGCIKMENLWIDKNRADEATDDDPLFFSLPDGNIWRFHIEELKDQVPHYIQLEASLISDLYNYSAKLYQNNIRLARQYARQQTLLNNIVEINHEKEILQAKINIHADLGRSILTTKQHLSSQTLTENITYLADIWNDTIRRLSDVNQINAAAEISPEIELQKAADMIGCHISFTGDRPAGRKTTLLFYALVREALTNSVTHAKADQLNVIINPAERGYLVEITDNGTAPVLGFTEGSGLSNLRRKLEQEGATLQVKREDGVVLIAKLPAEEASVSVR